jgi:hypothetical protein
VTLQAEDLGVDDLKEDLADPRERALDPGAIDDTLCITKVRDQREA